MKKNLQVHSRLIHSVLSKYPGTFSAFRELINNSIQAQATKIDITIEMNDSDNALAPSAFKMIEIRDNGRGVARDEFENKILKVANDNKPGGKGIGRFAALQIAKEISITTVAKNNADNKFYKITCHFDMEELRKVTNFQDIIVDLEVEDAAETYSWYSVKLENFYTEAEIEKEKSKMMSSNFMLENIEKALFEYYYQELLENKVCFFVNGSILNPMKFISQAPEKKTCDFETLEGKKYQLDYTYVLLSTEKAGAPRISFRTNNAGLHSAVHSFEHTFDIPEDKQWFVSVDSEYFNETSDMFRNLLVEALDPQLSHLKHIVTQQVDDFFISKYKDYKAFVDQLTADESYPYHAKKASETKKKIFNQIAFGLEKKYKLLAGKDKTRKIIYPLLDHSLSEGNISEIIQQVLKLDKDMVKKFHTLLSRVNIEEIITFSDMVSHKLETIHLLEELIYGDCRKRVKERSQLHKIVEKNLWLFGEQYANGCFSLSDKNLENNLKQFREEFLDYKPTAKDDNLIPEKKSKNITDLFFFSQKIIDENTKEVLVVELKAPRVKLNDKEKHQLSKYADQIIKSPSLSTNIKFKLILLGSEIGDSIRNRLGKDAKDYFLLDEVENVKCYAIKWADLLERAKRKLSYLSQEMNIRDRSIQDFLQENFPEINIGNLNSHKDKPQCPEN